MGTIFSANHTLKKPALIGGEAGSERDMGRGKGIIPRGSNIGKVNIGTHIFSSTFPQLS